MVLTHYARSKAIRLTVRGTESQLEPIAQVLQRLFPGEVTVTSDEDEAQAGDYTPDQLEILQDITDYNRELALRQPAPACPC